MDFSGIWNHILLNSSTVCLQPSPVIEVVTSCIASSDTSSSLSSDNRLAETANDDDDVGTTIEKKVSSEDAEDKTDANDNALQTKSIHRVRYCKEEYRCKQCPYTCTTEKAFLRHLRCCECKVTEAEKHLYSCPICGKDRKSQEILSAHMVKHKQDKYFCCDICKFKSLQLKKLIQHRRMHTGEKPHLCPFCSYRSSRRDNLRSHVRRVHKKYHLTCDTFTPRSMVLSARKLN